VSSWGRNPWPRRFGGGRREHYEEHIALLDALATGWDISEDQSAYAESYAHAVGLSFVWIVNKRLANQIIPERMTDMLAEWEQACRLRPLPNESVLERRRRVAAKFRGIAGNRLADIIDTCQTLLGASFVGIVNVDPLTHLNYWPGVNPGPPGFEWSSTRCILGVRVQKDLLSESEFLVRRQKLAEALDAMLPAWMSFRIGVGSSFVVNEGIVGSTFL